MNLSISIRALVLIVTAATLAFSWPASAEWSFHHAPVGFMPGSKLEVRQSGKPVAALIYGEGQIKPYLHVYGEDGELVTEWAADQLFPHHRGIFIGWTVASELGSYDLWHLAKGGQLELLELEKLRTAPDHALIVAKVAWRAAKADASGSNLLLTETRVLRVSRPNPGATQVDARFLLEAARDLTLGGDLHHAGVHFRAARQVADRKSETSYLSEPDGVAKGNDLKWCRFLFPIGDRWYSALQMNAPTNPVEELSMRDYGRFGYFFKKPLIRGEVLDLNYRFLIAPAQAPSSDTRPAAGPAARKESQRAYRSFVESLPR